LVLQSCEGCPFVPKVLIAAKYAGVEVKSQTVEKGKQGYDLGHPLKKCPVLKVGNDVIFESNSIARYVAQHNEASKLFGTNAFEAGEVDAWIDLAANEIDRPVALWLHTVQGSIPNDQEATKKAIADVRKVLQSLYAHLLTRTFLVRDRLTLADIVVAVSLLPAYRLLLDPGFRKAFKNANRWFLTAINQPNFVAVLGEVALCDKKPVAPAPEKKEEPKKEQPKPKPKDDDEEDDVPKEPKKKPFSNLPPSKFVLNDFKVAYSNEDYRTVALPHFYQHYDPEGWSLWLAEYKYTDDLKGLQSFMVNNLLGGLVQRAENIRDFSFGSFLVFGDSSNYEIHGAILLRGTEWPADVMGEIPDVDSYNFRKVDLNNVEDKEWFEDLWGWDGKLKGKTFSGQGKIMK